MVINRQDTDYVGLFGYTGTTATVRNVALADSNVTGKSYVGGLVGYNSGTISDSSATGSVTGSGDHTGGLVGSNEGSISDSSAAGVVIGVNYVGGLVGYNTGALAGDLSHTGDVTVSGVNYVGGLLGYNSADLNGSNATITATGTVSGANFVGGLVGQQDGGTISGVRVNNNVHGGNYVGGLVGLSRGSIVDSSASGTVDGDQHVGGLAGAQGDGRIQNSSAMGIVRGNFNVGGLVGHNIGAVNNSYATGEVNGTLAVGGLVGGNDLGTISNSYATGDVNGSTAVGGLVGMNIGNGLGDTVIQISNSYATGKVNGATDVGGLVGDNEGNIRNSYFDKTTGGPKNGVGLGDAAGVTGLSTDEMQQSKNFSGFDFDSTWFSYDGHTSPLLRSFLTTLTVTVNASGSKTYDGTTACTSGLGCEASYFDSLGKVFGEAVYALDSKNTGSRSATASGLYSDQQGYLINYVQGGTATITPKPVTISGITAADKTYDGTASAKVDATKASGWIDGDKVSVSASGSFADKNAASASKTVNLSSSYSGVDKDNYLFTDQASTTASITPKALTIEGTSAAGKTYDGNTSAAITVGALSGFVDEEKVSASAIGTFDSKDPGVRSATAKYTLADNAETGGQAANYQLADTTGLSATIEKAPVEKVAAGDATTGVDIKNTASWVASQNKQSQQVMQAQIITATVAPVQITQPVLVRSIGVRLPDGAYQKESVVLVPLDIPLTALMLPSLRKLAPDAADKREP
jgi:hypothetical protein